MAEEYIKNTCVVHWELIWLYVIRIRIFSTQHLKMQLEVVNPNRPGPFQLTVRPRENSPAVDMNFFLYTILEIHIFKATMQSFSSLAIKTWM